MLMSEASRQKGLRKYGRSVALLATVVAMASPADAAFAQTGPPPSAAEARIKTLDRAAIDALLATPEKVLVIDVRRADEISTIGGFPVFLNIQSADLERLIGYVPRDRDIITVSNHAHRAVRAGAQLAARGFRVAGAAGVQDYEAQGGTLVGKKAASPAPADPGPRPD